MANATRVSDQARGYLVGSYTGTTAAQNIHLGFKPAMLHIWNRTDGDTVIYWSKAVQTTYVGVTSAAATVTAVIAPVDNGTVIGFSLATDAVANENNKVYDFIAFPE